ncbi:prolyl oligopeptidase family serine peptidase [Streptomyces sp. NPDC052051]|uniref:prolyl oligopeptidase family serine peptidase n=1 Tax=Streptomyces sp. NPDC052051 TaxID=3154649 RepID=UPI003441A62B
MTDEEYGAGKLVHALREAVTDDIFGRRVHDPYRWLEDASCERTVEWQTAQDALYDASRRGWTQRFGPRLRELYGAAEEEVPLWRGGRKFFLRRQPGGEHAVLCTTTQDEAERVLLDPDRACTDQVTVVLERWSPSPDGRLVACQLSADGAETANLMMLDVASGRLEDDGIKGCRNSPVAWLPDSRSFYYVRPPYERGTSRLGTERWLWLHQVGTCADDDIRVLGSDDDPRRVYDISLDGDGRLLLASVSLAPASPRQLLLADLARWRAERPLWRRIRPGNAAHVRGAIGPDGLLYLLTDDQAPHRRLCVVDPAQPNGQWREVIKEDPEAVLTGFAHLGGGLLLAVWARDAISDITVHHSDTGETTGHVPLPRPGTMTGLTVNATTDDVPGEAWLGYSSMTEPSHVLRYDGFSGRLVRLGHSARRVAPPHIKARHVRYPSKDGTPVGMLLLAPDAAPRRPRPLLLTGYGGFGVSMGPVYQPDAVAWVEAGGVYAVAQVRGGGEQGAQWHRAGTGAGKQNSIDDFNAAAEWLVSHGWTTPDQLGAVGSSNGGLLVGAALVQRPELYRAVVCSAPLLDMVRYEQSGLGHLWRAEYGRVNAPMQAQWLLDYSPYHHVREGTDYPAVLFAVFEGDTRVDPAHARKMCAALQCASSSGRPVLLRNERGSGHGKRTMSQAAALGADSLAFLSEQLGLES